MMAFLPKLRNHSLKDIVWPLLTGWRNAVGQAFATHRGLVEAERCPSCRAERRQRGSKRIWRMPPR